MSKLKHLQSVILSIAKDIDSICKEYSINYYLLGGSAIGAVRHHGFIPWDDDLDIVMSVFAVSVWIRKSTIFKKATKTGRCLFLN